MTVNEQEDKTSKNEPTLSEEQLARQKELGEGDDKDQKLFQSLQAQKEHWREKHNKLQTKNEELKSKIPPEQPRQKTDEENQLDELEAGLKKEERMGKIEFAVANRDLDAEDIEEISAYALGKGLTLEEAKDKEPMQAYLKAKQERVHQEKTTPSPSTRSPKIGKKSVDDLSDKELKENFGEVVDKVIKAKP